MVASRSQLAHMKKHTMRLFGVALLIPACTTSPAEETILPGVSNTPHLERAASDIACGEDISYYGNPEPDLRYSFAYDGDKFLRADGVWLAGGSTETSEYTWVGDNLTRIVTTASYGASSEIAASYDGTNLIDYSWSFDDGETSDQWSYVFADFTGALPASEVISQQGVPVVTYQLAYDSFERLVAATPDAGDPTTYNYDDAAGVITIDTGNGAFVGTLTYDAEGRALTETWTGSDPEMIDSEEVYAWNGDALSSVIYFSGSEEAPHTLELLASETIRYSCEAAKRGKGSVRKPRLQLRR